MVCRLYHTVIHSNPGRVYDSLVVQECMIVLYSWHTIGPADGMQPAGIGVYDSMIQPAHHRTGKSPTLIGMGVARYPSIAYLHLTGKAQGPTRKQALMHNS